MCTVKTISINKDFKNLKPLSHKRFDWQISPWNLETANTLATGGFFEWIIISKKLWPGLKQTKTIKCLIEHEISYFQWIRSLLVKLYHTQVASPRPNPDRSSETKGPEFFPVIEGKAAGWANKLPPSASGWFTVSLLLLPSNLICRNCCVFNFFSPHGVFTMAIIFVLHWEI